MTPRALVYLLLWTCLFCPPGAIGSVLIDHRDHSTDLWKHGGVLGDFQRRGGQRLDLCGGVDSGGGGGAGGAGGGAGGGALRLETFLSSLQYRFKEAAP